MWKDADQIYMIVRVHKIADLGRGQILRADDGAPDQGLLLLLDVRVLVAAQIILWKAHFQRAGEIAGWQRQKPTTSRTLLRTTMKPASGSESSHNTRFRSICATESSSRSSRSTSKMVPRSMQKSRNQSSFVGALVQKLGICLEVLQRGRAGSVQIPTAQL